MFCTKCGNQLPDGSTFCNKCGKQTTTTTTTTYVRPVHREPESKKGLIIMILGIAALGTFVTGSLTAASMPAAVVALIMGLIHMKEMRELGKTDSKAQLGTILGGVALGVNIFTTITTAILTIIYIVYNFLIFANKLTEYADYIIPYM